MKKRKLLLVILLIVVGAAAMVYPIHELANGKSNQAVTTVSKSKKEVKPQAIDQPSELKKPEKRKHHPPGITSGEPHLVVPDKKLQIEESNTPDPLPKTRSGVAQSENTTEEKNKASKPHDCVWNTLFSIATKDTDFKYHTPAKAKKAIQKGLTWMVDEQQEDGGWAAGFFTHYAVKKDKNNHMEKSDAATTAMVSMAILRSSSNLTSGPYSDQLNKSTRYLILAARDFGKKEVAPPQPKRKKEKGRIIMQTHQNFLSQVQAKLGQHIDVVLTTQYFSNVLDYTDHDPALKKEIKGALDHCVSVIEDNQAMDGSMKDGTWAAVLQSSLAFNALESANHNGAKVDTKALRNARDYQLENFDLESKGTRTAGGTGIVLYAVSGTVRSSAKEALKADAAFSCAKNTQVLEPGAEMNMQSLQKLGYNKAEAMKAHTAYQVYEASKQLAMDSTVLKGFGNDGGEEYLSFLQTGEAMIINYDHDWKTWYDNTSGGLLKQQNLNGSWNGSHCISSPTFCTAVCILILSINDDVDKLLALGTGKK